jgi:Xaa-Pro aminopeptidase
VNAPVSQRRIAGQRKVQAAAKAVLAELADDIGADDTEESIAARAQEGLRRRGIRETWYYDCPALVLLGTRTCASPSGRTYTPAREPVGETNLVTIDLSPSCEGYWGDCARSFFVEGGRVTCAPRLPDFVTASRFLNQLHAAMRRFVTRETTFHDLAVWTTRHLEAAGFVNLDFRQNVGHSLAARREDRLYLKEGNCRPLGDVDFFTFEPHVASPERQWGFKHEDVFYFDHRGALEEL